MSRKNSNKLDSGEAAPKPETEAKASTSSSERAPVTKLPDRTPKLTLDRAFGTRMGDSLVRAFIADQNAKGTGVRRLTRAEWKAEYEAFLTAPRS